MQRSNSQPKHPPLSEVQRAANALKHGLRSSLSAHSLYLLRGESPGELKQLRSSLEAEFRPHTPTQHILLQQLISTQIRYLRAQRYYVYLLNDQANALAYQSLADNGQAHQHQPIRRNENRISNRYKRTHFFARPSLNRSRICNSPKRLNPNPSSAS